jgi:hypothetical protein|uniref:Uncharacterized protein n=1 Tax=Eutreptiella gymnastica TaxID=73025 RepID=A0A7S4GAD5_9EUGL
MGVQPSELQHGSEFMLSWARQGHQALHFVQVRCAFTFVQALLDRAQTARAGPHQVRVADCVDRMNNRMATVREAPVVFDARTQMEGLRYPLRRTLSKGWAATRLQ